MKTSLVIASVLLAGVAFEVAAFRIGENQNQQNSSEYRYSMFKKIISLAQKCRSNATDVLLFFFSDQQWLRNVQTVFNDGYYNLDAIISNSNGLPIQNQYRNSDKHVMGGDNAGFDVSGSSRYNQNGGQNVQNGQNNEFSYTNDLSVQQQQQYKDQNRGYLAAVNGLVKNMVEKITALQQIALNHNIAGNGNSDLDSPLFVTQNSVKLPGDSYVRLYNNSMENLDNGNLELMYISPQKDTVFAQYQFNRVIAAGSFKSNVRNAQQGYYTVVLDGVYSNVTTGFYDYRHSVIRPAQYQSVDATVRTNDGSDTQEFDQALENRFLAELQHAIASEVIKSTDRGMIGQMKTELRRPMVSVHGAGSEGKLYDMRWKEDDVYMEMNGIALKYPEQVEQQLYTSVSYQRKTQEAYRMRYGFTLNNLQWTSNLIVESAGKRMTANSANFQIENVDFEVTIYNQKYQSSCGIINTNVQVNGLQYNLQDTTVQPELVSTVKNQLQKFIEHSLGLYIQENLKQDICNTSKY